MCVIAPLPGPSPCVSPANQHGALSMQQLRSLLLLPVPAGDTPCVKQAAVYRETIARQQLTVLCYSKTAQIPGGAPLEVQHRKRQKQRDVAKSRSDFFSWMNSYAPATWVNRLTAAPSVPHVLLI